jgi:hypothetical protein
MKGRRLLPGDLEGSNLPKINLPTNLQKSASKTTQKMPKITLDNLWEKSKLWKKYF